ncbi:DMT family transporter [uncultured Ruminococcus sp.]|uniref:DMT family transporter n=1 Tax=uncultured Ruminococcus sp. TaxID=165186 RepID=UPI0025F64EA8|nr:DMT family transporter [uncultured Ruminococcus sp.]
MQEQKKPLLQRGGVVCLCALICTGLWGSAFPCIKIGYRILEISSSDTASQLLFAGLRFTIAGILTILFGSILQKKILLPHVHSLSKIAGISLFQTILQYIFFYIGLAHTAAVKSSILGGTGVLFSILLVCLVFRQESMTLPKLLGCLIGFAGICLVSISGSGSTLRFDFHWNGEGALLLSNLANAISPILLKQFSKTENPVMLSGYQFFFGGICITILALLQGGSFSLHGITPVLLLLYMAMISAVAYTLWGILLQQNPVSSVTIYGFTIQIFGVLLSAVFLGEWEQIRFSTLLALLFVCLGIFLVNRPTSFFQKEKQ